MSRLFQNLVAETQKASGRIDILVNNAGGVVGQTGRPLEEVSAAEWRVIFAANLDGAFYCSQAVAPAMKAKALRPYRQYLERRWLGASASPVSKHMPPRKQDKSA